MSPFSSAPLRFSFSGGKHSSVLCSPLLRCFFFIPACSCSLKPSNTHSCSIRIQVRHFAGIRLKSTSPLPISTFTYHAQQKRTTRPSPSGVTEHHRKRKQPVFILPKPSHEPTAEEHPLFRAPAFDPLQPLRETACTPALMQGTLLPLCKPANTDEIPDTGMYRISVAETDQCMGIFEEEMQSLSNKRLRRETPPTELQHESRLYVVSELRRSVFYFNPYFLIHSPSRASRYLRTFVEDMWIHFPLNMSVLDDSVLDNFVHGGEIERIPLHVNLLAGLYAGTSSFAAYSFQ